MRERERERDVSMRERERERERERKDYVIFKNYTKKNLIQIFI
jgi:hypothetical protein